MTEATTAILARFSPAEWARAQALGFKIPAVMKDRLTIQKHTRRWSEARLMSEARKLGRRRQRAA